jgi:nucleotide-binding universal stress UspA family protein
MFIKPQILIATDFSINSDKALSVGKSMQKSIGGSLSVIHVSGIPLVLDWVTSEGKAKYKSHEFRDDTLRLLTISMNEQLKRCDLDCQGEVFFGDPYTELHKQIEEKKTDLLIMSASGKTGIFATGSLTQKMISTSSIPVLVAKRDSFPRRIACLIDPSAISEKLIKVGVELSHAFSIKAQFIAVVQDFISLGDGYLSELVSVGFTDDQKKQIITNVELEIMKRMVLCSKESIEVIVSKHKIATVLFNFLNESNIDLAVMSRNNRGILDELIIGSTSRRLLESFKGNILLLPK